MQGSSVDNYFSKRDKLPVPFSNFNPMLRFPLQHNGFFHHGFNNFRFPPTSAFSSNMNQPHNMSSASPSHHDVKDSVQPPVLPASPSVSNLQSQGSVLHPATTSSPCDLRLHASVNREKIHASATSIPSSPVNIFSSKAPSNSTRINSARQVSNDSTPKGSRKRRNVGEDGKSPSFAPTIPTVVTIENPCLAFIRSELFRVPQGDVIDSAVVSFGIDELKQAREILYKKTGTIKYTYHGPHDPATSHQKSSHCVANIINKIVDLDRNNSQFDMKYVCAASDLHRLMNLNNFKTDSAKFDHRLSQVENELKSLRSSFQSKNPAPANPVAWPSVGSASNVRPSHQPGIGISSSRMQLINTMSSSSAVSSPNKRRRTDASQLENMHGARSQMNGSNSHSTLKGKPPNKANLKGAELHEVFLFNFDEDSTTEAVLKHFQSHDVSVKGVRFRCHPDSAVKKFVMKIQRKDDFEKVINALPAYTGCRWYDPFHRPTPGDRPQGFYNNGRSITGPRLQLVNSVQVTPHRSAEPSSPHPDHLSRMDDSFGSPPKSSPRANSSGRSPPPAAGHMVSNMIKPITASSGEATTPVVTTHNRFTPLEGAPGSPNFNIGGPISIPTPAVATDGVKLPPHPTDNNGS